MMPPSWHLPGKRPPVSATPVARGVTAMRHPSVPAPPPAPLPFPRTLHRTPLKTAALCGAPFNTHSSHTGHHMRRVTLALLLELALGSAAPVEAAASRSRAETGPQGTWTVKRPQAWRQVERLDPAGSVQASFYNPEVGGETLAVYGVPAQGKSLRSLGTAKEYGAKLASAAPGCRLLSAWAVPRGGQTYYITHILYSGVSAGLFGQAHEFRSMAVSKGVQYTCRVTAPGGRWDGNPNVRGLLQAVATSFRVL
mmetsp:Transcript_7762/g.19993  ORF Transcript_7762/g.19993 Transcript_7762/m.19993 type:complete len:253 (+) Transcript_7762:143-901(+)